jgi:transcriptional regulator with XRE-family HTH domain
MNSETQPTVAKLIKDLRLSLGETQTEFGERFGVSQVAVTYWEDGSNDPPSAVMLLLLNRLQEVKGGKQEE